MKTSGVPILSLILFAFLVLSFSGNALAQPPHGGSFWRQLTEEQREAVQMTVDEMRDQGASREDICAAVSEMLIGFGIELPEGWCDRTPGRHGAGGHGPGAPGVSGGDRANPGYGQQNGATSSAEDYVRVRNHPNPFNPATDIHFQISEIGSPVHTSLKIYNVLGQEVRTLVDGSRSAGYYTVTWDGRDQFGAQVASGFYFCRVQAGEYAATIRMFLMK